MQPLRSAQNQPTTSYVPASAAASIATTLGQEVLRALAGSEAPSSINIRTVTKASQNYNHQEHFLNAKKLALFRQYDRAWHRLKREKYTDPESHHLLGILYLNFYATSQEPRDLKKVFYHWEIAESMDFEGAPILAAVDLLLNSHLRPDPFSGEYHEVLLDHWYSGTMTALRKFPLFDLLLTSSFLSTELICNYMDSMALKLQITPGHPLLLISKEVSILNELCLKKLASLDLPGQARAARTEEAKREIWNIAKPLYLMISLVLLMRHPEPLVIFTGSRSSPYEVLEVSDEDKNFMELVSKIEMSPMKDVLKYGDSVLHTILKIMGIMFSPEKMTAVLERSLKSHKKS